MSCEAPPEELFLPLLGAALERGVNPNLGRAEKLPLERLKQQQQQQQQQQEEEEAPLPPPTGTRRDDAPQQEAAAGAPRGRDWGASAGAVGAPDESRGYVQGALVAEEVLMYHRAASRLAEMTRESW
jgi:hypothetical protein